MKRIVVFLTMLCLLAIACTTNKSVISFEATIDGIHEDKIVVNCSDEVNKGKIGPIDSIGYLCNVAFNSTTSFTDHNDNSLLIEDFSVGDLVEIKLSTPQNITEDNRQFDASEFVLMDAPMHRRLLR